MGHLVQVATCSLNQWALDFDGNLERIIQSIRKSKDLGCKLRVGPELEVSGYGCSDHFLESDTILHCWESIAQILAHPDCRDILIDLGSPVVHKNVLYNCRVIILNGEIILIRPKMWLANSGNYRETRWFTGWSRPRQTEEFWLPSIISDITGSKKVPFGDAVVSTADTVCGFETCEELFTPDQPSISMSLDGVEIIANSSCSHHQLKKLDQRLSLIISSTQRLGGIYLYSNASGCDGDRLLFDGCSLICVNGECVAQGSQFNTKDVEIVTAVCDLEEVRAKRASSSSRNFQAVKAFPYPRIEVSFRLSARVLDLSIAATPPQPVFYHQPEEEIAFGPACWIWDYLRRSGMSGFLLPLSGGIDSCATALIVYSMARIVYRSIQKGDETVLADCRRIAGAYEEKDWIPSSPQAIMKNLLHTVYMGMKNQSSPETRKRAKDLAKSIGSYHLEADIDRMFQACTAIGTESTGFEPKFKGHGGTASESVALENVQSRSRMVLAYYYAQILPISRQRPGGGNLLVLASANCDESLAGYLTKYDCSSADLNPIGSISKVDLRRFIGWCLKDFGFPALQEFIDATPSAELVPIKDGSIQSDEQEMGLTYAELSDLGQCRKNFNLGPYSTFLKLLATPSWKDTMSVQEIAEKTKKFYHRYFINRHKMTTITPSYHAESYQPDDNRYDLRPFLYPPAWNGRAFKKIDELVKRIEKEQKKQH